MMNAFRIASVCGGLALTFAATAATADDNTDFAVPNFYGRGKNTSVMERERPDYDAVGIHAGGFTLFPKLQAGVIATNNILDVPNAPTASPPTHPQSDFGFLIAPSVTAQSNWGRHSLTVAANVQQEEFTQHSSEDQTTGGIRADGQIDVHDESYIDLGADLERDVIERGGTTSQTIEGRPVPYDTETAYARGVYGVDRFRATAEADLANYNFLNVPRVGGGSVDENVRDYSQDRVLGRVDYALSPDAALFTSISYGSEHYPNATPSAPPPAPPAAPARNSNETRVLAGANFDITALARGEIGIGYIDRHYAASYLYRPLSGLAVSSKVEYFPTQLITITFIGQRLIEDSAFNLASGYFKNFASLGADYEFKRNIILSVLGSLERDTFQGVSRTDNASAISASGKYLVNRNVGIGATLAYANRTSTATTTGPFSSMGPAYNELRFTLNLVLQR
jgi:hypothetical protein